MATWRYACFCRRFWNSYTEFVENVSETKLPEYLNLKAIPDEGTLCKEDKRLKPFLDSVTILLILPEYNFMKKSIIFVIAVIALLAAPFVQAETYSEWKVFQTMPSLFFRR